MISANELSQMKERLLIAGATARAMVESRETLRFDEEQYWRVHLALSMLHTDVSVLLAELDTLRSMFLDRVSEFIGTGGLTHEVSGIADKQDAANPVDGSAAPDDSGSGDTKRDDPPAVSSPVPAKRTKRGRPRKPRPVEGDDPASVPGVSGEVDSGAGGSEVGG
jgi:hypothetical protein